VLDLWQRSSQERLPEIEKYANAPDWEEGTLVEQMTNEEILEQEARNVQKQADLETCGQVPTSYKRQIRPVTHHQQQSKSQLTGPRHSVPAYSRVFYALTPNIQTDLAILIKLNIF